MKFPISFRRHDAAAYHETLNPEKDQVEIFTRLFKHEFPAEFLLSAEIQQLHSFTFPHGTRLLHATGEFEKNSLKRLDDTRAILYEMGRDDFYSPRAEQMASHLNKIHGMYNIPNDEFLHTLSTFIYDLWGFINEFGWRKLTRNEELAIYHTYVRMGELMNIRDIPESFEAFKEWKKNYELENQAYSETNHLVAEGLMRGAREMLPAVLGPFLLPFVLSLKNKRFADLLGYRYPNILVRGFFRGVMRVRQLFNRLFTVWDVWDFEQALFKNYQTYPNGYNPMKLGPDKIIKYLEKADRKAETA
ncbi:MAG: oxygenase MpaB family protein [Chloroflexota bacterium]